MLGNRRDVIFHTHRHAAPRRHLCDASPYAPQNREAFYIDSVPNTWRDMADEYDPIRWAAPVTATAEQKSPGTGSGSTSTGSVQYGPQNLDVTSRTQSALRKFGKLPAEWI